MVDLTARWLPGMIERGEGAVLVTASTAAFQPLPGNGVYAAGKSFALSFAEEPPARRGRAPVAARGRRARDGLDLIEHN